MTRETDAVFFARCETWRKAIAAAREADVWFDMTSQERLVMISVVRAVVDAARADGVTLDEPSP